MELREKEYSDISFREQLAADLFVECCPEILGEYLNGDVHALAKSVVEAADALIQELEKESHHGV